MLWDVYDRSFEVECLREQWNLDRLLRWWTRACVILILCSTLFFLCPWAMPLSFNMPSVLASSAFVLAEFLLCLECSSPETFMSDSLSFRFKLGLFWPHNLQKSFSPSLPHYPLLFLSWFFLNGVQAPLVTCLISTSLSAKKLLILFEVTVCPHRYSVFLVCLACRHSSPSDIEVTVCWTFLGKVLLFWWNK